MSFDAAVDAIRAAGIETVRGLPDSLDPAPVGWALSALRSANGRSLRLVLPTAGDVRGVPTVMGLPAAAVRAGQVVVGSGLAFLPDQDRCSHGGWQAHDVSNASPVVATPGEQQTVAQAAGALRLAVLEATDALAALEVARWNPGVASLSSRQVPLCLPPDHDPSAAALATRCAQLDAVLDLAGADAPGAAINAFAASRRDAALRPLGLAVREALMTAYSAGSVQPRIDR